MADYKELLRRAVEALPENNGQARRAVYEKARAALVGQLRAITPPLAARDITTHRLQLEDCIRQVEQEASEAVIAGMQEPPPPPAKVQTTQAPKLETRAPGKPQPAPNEPPLKPSSIEEIIAASEITAPEPVPVKPETPKVVAKPEGKPAGKPEIRAQAKPAAKPEAASEPIEEAKLEGKGGKPNGRNGRPLPAIVARAEAAKGKSQPSPGGLAMPDGGRRGPTLEPRTGGPRFEPAFRGQLAARQQMVESVAYAEQPAVSAAMSAVREVELEAPPAESEPHADPQGAIDRAIAALDREARGETHPPAAANGNVVELQPVVAPQPEPQAPVEEAPPTPQPTLKRGVVPGAFREQTGKRERSAPARDRKGRKVATRRDARGRKAPAVGEVVFQRAPVEAERGGAGALTIFLAVFAMLLLGVGGAGVWAWREGYIDLDAMFGRSGAAVPQATAEAVVPQASANAAAGNAANTAAVAVPMSAAPADATGPGNTATVEPELVTQPKAEERLTPSDAAGQVQATTAAAEPLALVEPTPPAKTDERLPDETAAATTQTAEQAAEAAVDPAALAGSQSLLLEAQDNGTTGAVPFSGTVDWSRGKDETGASTLIAKATIPARNLTVDVLIRKNSDPSLPASHLMEINFSVPESFIGGSVAGLPGVLLKNEELVQGTPLVGASARVVGNSFLFALSASPQDSATNNDLLTSRKWMDLAIIYATGKRAIITLEKDEAADKMFHEVFAEWGKTAAAPTASAPPAQ